jgi:CheY-like chemotaxis protein
MKEGFSLTPLLFTSEKAAFPFKSFMPEADVYGAMRQTVYSQQILLVDDEPTVRDTIEMLLTIEGHHVEAVSSGAEALEKLAKQPYDFVFTDHIMAGMSGERLAREIKAKYPRQIVVMLTAYAEVLDQLTQEGPLVDFTLSKPIDIRLLRHILLRLSPEKSR